MLPCHNTLFSFFFCVLFVFFSSHLASCFSCCSCYIVVFCFCCSCCCCWFKQLSIVYKIIVYICFRFQFVICLSYIYFLFFCFFCFCFWFWFFVLITFYWFRFGFRFRFRFSVYFEMTSRFDNDNDNEYGNVQMDAMAFAQSILLYTKLECKCCSKVISCSISDQIYIRPSFIHMYIPYSIFSVIRMLNLVIYPPH